MDLPQGFSDLKIEDLKLSKWNIQFLLSNYERIFYHRSPPLRKITVHALKRDSVFSMFSISVVRWP